MGESDVITPIDKDVPKTDSTNLRPIASLSNLSLACDKIIYATVSRHLKNK